jgi:hypothetical protein
MAAYEPAGEPAKVNVSAVIVSDPESVVYVNCPAERIPDPGATVAAAGSLLVERVVVGGSVQVMIIYPE